MLLSRRFPGLPPETLADWYIIKNTMGGAWGAAIPKGCQAYPQEPPYQKRDEAHSLESFAQGHKHTE